MPFSNTYSNNILNFLFGKANLTAPSSVYIGLCSNDPEADGGTITELSGGGYSRVLIALRGEAYPNQVSNASDRAIKNNYQINWTKATTDWVDAQGFFLADAAVGGNIFFYGKLEKKISVEAGMVALFDPSALRFRFPKKDAIGGTILYAMQAIGPFTETVEGSGYAAFQFNGPLLTLAAGTDYTVVWDGTEYFCTGLDAGPVDAEYEGWVFIGNAALAAAGETVGGLPDSGEPFVIGVGNGMTVFMAHSTEETHSAEIYRHD